MTSGDDLRLTLRRKGGQYSLVVDNLTRRSSSTLTIAHPSFLDGETDLHLGLFGANTQSDLAKTLTVREVSVTVWTTQPASPTMVATASRSPSASRLHAAMTVRALDLSKTGARIESLPSLGGQTKAGGAVRSGFNEPRPCRIP